MNLTPKQTIKGTVTETQDLNGSLKDIPSVKGTVAETQSLRGSMKDIPSLDNTLTKEGYAADAKAVGEALDSKAPISHTEDKGNPHGVTASQVGARPDTWMPSASEIGARPDNWMPTASDVGARPDNWTPTAEEVGARPNTWTPTAQDVGARPDDWLPTAQEVGARPNTWTPSAQEVGARPKDWTPTAEDVGARPNTWMPTASETGAVAKADLMKLSHSALDDNGAWTVTSVTSYPTRPGIYRCTGDCPNLPVGVNGYGNLQITSAGGYALHLYREGGMLYFAESTTYDETISVPASWKVAGGTKKLWENASPTSRFIPQTITLSGYTQFNAIIVLYKAHISFDIGGDWAQTLIIGRPGKAYRSQLYDTGAYPQNVERMYEWNSSGIAFGSGCYHQGTTYSVSNDFAIPIAIYGI